MTNINEILLKIGNEIKHLRKEKKYTQEKLAELSNVDRTFIGGIERGEKNLSIFILIQILDVFDTDLYSFFREIYETK